MKKNYVLLSIIPSLVLTGTALAIASNNHLLKTYQTRGTDYVLDFTSEEISERTSSYVDEVTASIATTNNNSLEFKASNVVHNASGWQTVLPNGYFYNPIKNVTNYNKISGISSIRFDSESGKNLTLCYGHTIDNQSIIYSQEKTLTPNVEYSLGNINPTYFYIKNNNNTNVDISRFTITYSCNDVAYQKQDLNVLMIGNSFADDTVFYASRVANAYGLNLNLYDAYIASCTIDMHYTNITEDNASYSMRNIVAGNWNYANDMTLTQIINSRTWDIITFQQASAVVGREASYEHLEDLVDAVRTLTGSGPKFYWYQTWAYDNHFYDSTDTFAYFGNDQLTMFDAINDCYESEVASLCVFDKMIPAGTAVQNLRTSYMDNTFTRDGKHMSSMHGRYLLGLNFLSNIYDIDLDMSPCSYLPTEIDASFKNVAYESIKNAYKTPLDYTNSLYTTRELANYDLADYTEIDAELLGCSFWNSTDTSNYNKRQSNVSGTSNYYVTTKRFTSSELPVGSLVVIDDSFGIRPEAWVSDAAQGSRPAEIYNNVLEIDSSFFASYLYRAFNIFKIGKPELKGQYDQIFDGFHIYVPNASMGGLTPKGTNANYAGDKTIFKNNLLNIDAYERLQLDPITGFYKCDSYYELTNSYVDDTAKKFLCTRPFYGADGDLPENTVIIVDNGYRWRPECWGSYGTYSPRPDNVTTTLVRLNSSIWSGFTRRAFNISSTSSSYVGQNYISFMNHMRIYVPVSNDIELEPEDTVTMLATGSVPLKGAATIMFGDSTTMLISLTGDDVSHVLVQLAGSTITTTGYTYNKTNGALSITTEGNLGDTSYNVGTITGVVDRANGQIKNIGIDGSLAQFVNGNGSVVLQEQWSDNCDYASDSASQDAWQRWYMSGSWQRNTGNSQPWTSSNSTYHLEYEHSMGLRIANNSYQKTRFTLRADLNGGSGVTAKGVSVWLYNPNGNIYPCFRIYVCSAASTAGDGYVTPNSLNQVIEKDTIGNNEWTQIQVGFNSRTVYNISLYFECSSSETTYVYLGRVSLF